MDENKTEEPAELRTEGLALFEVAMKARFAAYVQARAAAHGRTAEDEIAALVVQFWQTDQWRLNQAPGMARPGKAGAHG